MGCGALECAGMGASWSLATGKGRNRGPRDGPDQHAANSRSTLYAAVGAVPTPTRYVQGAPSFNPPNADQPLSPPNTTDVLVFVAYPPSDAKDLRLGAKVRLMAIETC